MKWAVYTNILDALNFMYFIQNTNSESQLENGTYFPLRMNQR